MGSKTRSRPRSPRRRRGSPSFVAGLGASAGGIGALEQFFAAMPGDSGGAFVVVLHLDPTHSSSIAEILGRHTTMPVSEAMDGEHVRPDHVYVIPSNRTLTIGRGALHLEIPAERRGFRMPIDRFFSSLGEDQKQKAIGIVLSGTGSDGTVGLKVIMGSGGLTVAQDPATADQTGMVRSAIEMRVVDKVLPVGRMAEFIVRYARHAYTKEEGGEDSGDEGVPDRENVGLGDVLAVVRTQVRLDFSSYRKGTIRRRVQRRMGIRQIPSIEEYVRALRNDPEEVEKLAGDMLIGVTGFFREREAWESLEALAIRPLVAAKTNGESIRAWVPACASGEEAYTLAFFLLRQLEAASKVCSVQVFATDVDHSALEIARAGLYPARSAADVAPADLERFFVREGDGLRVAKRVRDVIVFASQNVIADPPYLKLDLISCRNLLIYLEPDRQKKLLSLFHFALRPDGYLFLGHSETAGQQNDQFSVLSRKWRVYRRTGPAKAAPLDVAIDLLSPGSPVPPADGVEPRGDREVRHAEQAVLRRFAPACLLIDRRHQVRFAYGPTGEFLKMPEGPLTSDLFEWTHGSLRTKLRGALQRVWERRDGVEAIDMRAGRNAERAFKVTVEPLSDPRDPQGLALVAFHGRTAGDGPETVLSDTDRSVVEKLEEELKETRDDLQTTIEDLQVSNEKFRAVNEEALSINEELQSTNEELETSKEELQSLNEELLTVNFQLQTKLAELEQRNDDLDNLLQSTDLAVIFLDPRLRIKWFSPAMTSLLSLLPSDAGRSLGDFAARFTDPDLFAEAEAVLGDSAPFTREIRTHDGRWYLRRVLPYRTRSDRIDGVVITFTDIHARRVAELELQERADDLERRVAERTSLLQLLQDVAAAANEAVGVDEAVTAALRLVCTHTGWSAGHAWEVDDPSGLIVPLDVWHIASGRDFSAFVEATMRTTLVPGEVLVRNTIATGRPQWIGDVHDERFVRGDIAAFGLRAAATIPVPVKDQVVMVLELYSIRPESEPSRRLIASLHNVGIHVGHVIERRRLEKVIADQIERERRTVGDELHDSLGQSLAGLAFGARELLSRSEELESPLAGSVTRLYQGLESAKDELRRVIRGMLPAGLDGYGLTNAIIDLAETAESRYDKRCRVICDDPASIEIDDGFVGIQLYRIAQEALRNAISHADASEIVIALRGDGKIELEVRDNGHGDWSKGRSRGRGVSIMRYRADLIGGRVHLAIEPGAGTIVRCTVPRRAGPPRSSQAAS